MPRIENPFLQELRNGIPERCSTSTCDRKAIIAVGEKAPDVLEI